MYHTLIGGSRGRIQLLRSSVAALVIALGAISPFGGSPTAALADTPFTDITGSPVQVDIRFPDKDSGSMIELPIPSNQLSKQGQQFLSAPLNQWFDQYWSGTPDKDGKTVRDRSCDAAKGAAGSSVGAATGQTAYDITCGFPATGTLSAAQVGSFLQLSYVLHNNVIGFKTTTPDACALGVCVGAPATLDPRFTLTFDTELLVSLTIPDSPCALQVAAATVLTHNANIDSGNFTGDIVKGVIDLFSGGTFPSVEAQLDNTTQPIQLNLGGTLSSLTSGCDTARQQGITQFDTPIDASQGKLTFRLTHPLDNAIGLTDVFAQAAALQQQSPSFEHPTIGLSQTEVNPGAQVTVAGTFFQPAETNLHVIWFDTISGPVKETDIEWGPKGGKIQSVTIPRKGARDGLNQFQTGNLTPSATYQIRVRDCDAITCTPWSDWLLATMAPSGSDQVRLFLDDETLSNQIGTSVVNPDGTFSAQATIPGAASAGSHTVVANLGGTFPAAAAPSFHLATGTTSRSAIIGPSALVGPAPRPASPPPAPSSIHAVTGTLVGHATGTSTIISDVNAAVLAGGQGASADLTVCGASACQPVVQVVDPTTQSVIASVMEGSQVTVHGSGFPIGVVELSLDSASAKILGGGGVGSEGSFVAQITIPRGVTGNHNLVAFEKAAGKTVPATDALFISQIPR